MSRTFKHYHRCQGCGTKTECWGQLEDNWDGEPEITCAEFHQRDGSVNPDFICEACEMEMEDALKADLADLEEQP